MVKNVLDLFAGSFDHRLLLYHAISRGLARQPVMARHLPRLVRTSTIQTTHIAPPASGPIIW